VSPPTLSFGVVVGGIGGGGEDDDDDGGGAAAEGSAAKLRNPPSGAMKERGFDVRRAVVWASVALARGGCGTVARADAPAELRHQCLYVDDRRDWPCSLADSRC
jgi:hypothetical protein